MPSSLTVVSCVCSAEITPNSPTWEMNESRNSKKDESSIPSGSQTSADGCLLKCDTHENVSLGQSLWRRRMTRSLGIRIFRNEGSICETKVFLACFNHSRGWLVRNRCFWQPIICSFWQSIEMMLSSVRLEKNLKWKNGRNPQRVGADVWCILRNPKLFKILMYITTITTRHSISKGSVNDNTGVRVCGQGMSVTVSMIAIMCGNDSWQE